MRLAVWMILMLIVSSGGLAQQKWNYETTKDSISVWTRSQPGSSVKEVMAQGVVNSPSWRVFKVVTDNNDFKNFMPYMKVSTIVRREGATVSYFYAHINPPMVSDRDYTIRLVNEKNVGGKAGYYRSSWSPANNMGPAKKDGLVRVEINTGYWYLEPANGGKDTKVTYYLNTDPGGVLPKWIVNAANKKTVPDIIIAVRKQIVKAKYSCVNGTNDNCQD